MELKSVKDFKKQYDIGRVSSRVLQSIIEEQGYTVIEYNGISDRHEVETLIDVLGIRGNIESSNCFVYQDNFHRILFINENLNEEERRIVLAHEEGHIWNKHLMKNATTYESVQQEFEANEFAHYLLKEKGSGRKQVWIGIGAAVILCILSVLFFLKKHNDATYTEKLYVTDSGTKYHRKECVYIRDRKDVRRMTLDEFNSGEFEACEVCFPDDQGQE